MFYGQTPYDVNFEPLSPSASDIILQESDSDNDCEERSAKRRRIEHKARAYLDGQLPLIFSAALKGPFSNGWGNPWSRRKGAYGATSDANRPKKSKEHDVSRPEKEQPNIVLQQQVSQQQGFNENVNAKTAAQPSNRAHFEINNREPAVDGQKVTAGAEGYRSISYENDSRPLLQDPQHGQASNLPLESSKSRSSMGTDSKKTKQGGNKPSGALRPNESYPTSELPRDVWQEDGAVSPKASGEQAKSELVTFQEIPLHLASPKVLLGLLAAKKLALQAAAKAWEAKQLETSSERQDEEATNREKDAQMTAIPSTPKRRRLVSRKEAQASRRDLGPPEMDTVPSEENHSSHLTPNSSDFPKDEHRSVKNLKGPKGGKRGNPRSRTIVEDEIDSTSGDANQQRSDNFGHGYEKPQIDKIVPSTLLPSPSTTNLSIRSSMSRASSFGLNEYLPATPHYSPAEEHDYSLPDADDSTLEEQLSQTLQAEIFKSIHFTRDDTPGFTTNVVPASNTNEASPQAATTKVRRSSLDAIESPTTHIPTNSSLPSPPTERKNRVWSGPMTIGENDDVFSSFNTPPSSQSLSNVAVVITRQAPSPSVDTLLFQDAELPSNVSPAEKACKPKEKRRASFAPPASVQAEGDIVMQDTSQDVSFKSTGLDMDTPESTQKSGFDSAQMDTTKLPHKGSLKSALRRATRLSSPVPSFSITPDGEIIHRGSPGISEKGDMTDVDDAIQDANNFLESWDVKTAMRKPPAER